MFQSECHVSATKRAAIFFDRDNTLIANDGYLGDPAGVRLVDGAADAVARARRLGFVTVVFSNQSGVARGMFGEDDVRAVNARMEQMLLERNGGAVIDRHEFCPYHPEATVEEYRRDSDLRKPRPGMIRQAAEKLALDLSRSWVVGDAPRDVEAGHAAGCRTVLVRHPDLPPSPAANSPAMVSPDVEVSSLAEALDAIERSMMPAAAAPAAGGESAINFVPDGNRHGGATAAPAADTVHASAPAEPAGEPEAPFITRGASAPVMPPDASVQPPALRLTEAGSDESAGDPAAARSSPNGMPTGPAAKPAAIAGKATTLAVLQAAAAKKKAQAGEAPAGAAGGGTTNSMDEVKAADAPPRPARVDEPSPAAPSNLARLESLAEQVLQELRRRRDQGPADFSVSKLLAGIVQVLVGAALFWAYLRWETPSVVPVLLVALVLQTLTISLLVMGRQSS